MSAAPMKPKLLLIAGFLMVPVCFVGLLYQQSFVWAVCPQALIAMFFRQSQHAYDSLGAADFPDLAVALLYYPLVGLVLSRASREGELRRIGFRVAILHIFSIGLALAAGQFRNRIWAGQ